MNHGPIQPLQPIQIAPIFAQFPFRSLVAGITDKLLDGWANYVDPEEPGARQDKPSPRPDRSQIETFIRTVFKHATPGHWISLRAFYEGRADLRPCKIVPVKLNNNLDALIDQVLRVAELAARSADKVVFCPPVATFTKPKRAREQDLAEGLVLSVECDAHAQAARKKLEELLGQATMVVESGGMWTDPETGKAEPKLHLHYRLKLPASTKEAHQKLKAARRLAAAIVGADPSNVTIVHPIRWPGSVHRKAEAKLCRIIDLNAVTEIDLDRALEILRNANGDATHADTRKSPSPPIEVASAFAHLDPKQGLAQGIAESPPLPFAPIKAECGWLRHVHDTGGADQSEPQWKLALNACIFLTDGQTLIHEFSNKHKGYVREDTEAKYDHACHDQREKDLGWPLCKTIHDNGTAQCKSCPHLAEGKSPLHLARQQHNASTTIRIIKGEIARIVDEAEAALIVVPHIAPIMVRARMLVQPIIDLLPASHGRMTEVALLRPLTVANLVYLLNKHAATFRQYDGRSKKWLTVDPPPAVATQLLQKGHWQFPKVAGVITAPTLRPDGSILDQPGYDSATQLWYRPDSQLVLPQLLEAPTREQARQALRLLTDLLVNFPFERGVDRSVALAAVLTTVLRGAFDVVPMYLLRAHDVGNGKSFLADVISVIARGQICPVITNVKSVDEMEKRLGALVLEGVPIISLDNCSSDIGGDLLCQITERRRIRIRILGKSEAPECEWRGVLFSSGNNVAYLGDMTRRGLTANLDAKVERPEQREFSFNPIERVLADRGRYIAAAFTIARAYIAAGAPKVCGSLGSYETWSDFVRSPLIWLGQDDPVKSMDTAREDDPLRRAEHNLITIWRAHLGLNVGYTAADLIWKANEQKDSKWACPHLRELFLQLAGTPQGDIDARKVGNWLRSILGRVYDGHRIECVKESKSWGNTYALLRM